MAYAQKPFSIPFIQILLQLLPAAVAATSGIFDMSWEMNTADSAIVGAARLPHPNFIRIQVY